MSESTYSSIRPGPFKLQTSDVQSRPNQTPPQPWEDDRFLVTPPIQTAQVNPLDQALTEQNVHAFHANQQASAQNAQISVTPPSWRNLSGQDSSHLLNGLHIRTDVEQPQRSYSTTSVDSENRLRTSASYSSLPRRAPSVRAVLHSSAGSVSPGTTISSPQISAMLDITPLPSPTMASIETWKPVSRTRSRGSSIASLKLETAPVFSTSTLSPSSPRRKGYYHGLQSPTTRPGSSDSQHMSVDDPRNRSVSEYVPEALAIPKPRHIVVSTSAPRIESQSSTVMQREEFLGEQRGIAKAASLPAATENHHDVDVNFKDAPPAKRAKMEVFHARSLATGELRSYESLRLLGQGTFSKVYLAVRQVHDRKDSVDYRQDSVNMAGVKARSRRLVAVKVVEHGPAGGADAERIEIGLKREVDILKAIQHPSLVHLKAFGHDGTARAMLVMNYCPGNDLFEVASKHQEVLSPPLIRRIFAELVSAVRYMHQKFLVHRDIKLENVLLNIPVRVHTDVSDWQRLDRAVVTLTDMGLSRQIPEPPESPLLTTRCGSEDYAAPEILMGQPYDGRQTDAWALGVLLYALMEGRLPFDPVPGARGDPAVLRARTPHRIARCEWAWVKYGDEDGEWDNDKGAQMTGARECVDGLLKRNTRRKALSEIREVDWVQNGIQVDGGLRWVEEESL